MVVVGGASPAAGPPCSLLTAEEVDAAIDAPASSGREGVGEGPGSAVCCWFNSPKGYVQIWSRRDGAADAYQAATQQPRLRPQVDVGGDGEGYEGFTWTSPHNVQEAHVLKAGSYVTITVGAGAAPGTAGGLVDLAVTRLR